MTAPVFFPFDVLAQAVEAPLDTVTKTAQAVAEQLELCKINTALVQIGVFGTVAIETASAFAPVREAFMLGEPEPAETYRKKLRYYPFYGRGLVQRTWESGYRAAGPAIASLWGANPADPTFDLSNNPDNLLDLDMASADLAIFFKNTRALPTPSWPLGYSLVDACNEQDDEWIRRLVYGGVDAAGAQRITRIRSMLQNTSQKLSYNPNQPPERQIQNWVCSIRSTQWMLKSLGINLDIGDLQDEMVPGTVTPALGLLDHRGYGIAATLGRHLPKQTKIEVLETVTWSDLLSRAGRGPIALGSSDPRLYHWFNISQVQSSTLLSSPNPAPNYPASSPLGDELSQAEFDRYANTWSAVFVEVTPEVSTPIKVTPEYRDTLIGVAYHPDGVVIPALKSATQQTDQSLRKEVTNVINFLENTNPDK